MRGNPNFFSQKPRKSVATSQQPIGNITESTGTESPRWNTPRRESSEEMIEKIRVRAFELRRSRNERTWAGATRMITLPSGSITMSAVWRGLRTNS
jgi:hypothetical protein